MSSSGTNAFIKKCLRKIEVNDGDFVVLRAGSLPATKLTVGRLSTFLSKTGRGKSAVVVVEDFNDLTVLDEEKMNKLGWYKKEPKS